MSVRKTSTIPTKIYTYGCLPPVEGQKEVKDQLWRAQKYRNALVEIELRRRAGIAEAQRQHDLLGPLLTTIEFLKAQIAEARREVKLLHAGGSSQRVARTADRLANKKLIKAMQTDLAVMSWLRAWTKSTLHVELELDESASISWAHAQRIKPWYYLGLAVYAETQRHAGARLQCAYAEVEEKAKAEIRAARSVSGLSSGTYLVVEKAAEAWHSNPSPPYFKRYDGQGRVAVQCQGGLTVAEGLSCEDTRLRIGPATPVPTKRHPEGLIKSDYRTLWIRVGSNGRQPVWAKFPILMHRQLPDDAVIKWAWVYCRRLGMRYRYECQFTVESPAFLPSENHSGCGTIAVDIGARDSITGVRVALWKDSFGASGEVVIPSTRLSSPVSRGKDRRQEVPNNDSKLEELRAIRSKLLDKIKAQIAAHRASAPEWFKNATQFVDKWRSPFRVVRFFNKWRHLVAHLRDEKLIAGRVLYPSVRHDTGDEELYNWVAAFLKKDRHLFDWDVCETRRRQLRRRDLFRTFSAYIAKKYEKVIVAERCYIKEKRTPENASPIANVVVGEVVSTADEQSKCARVLARCAAPGKLLDVIEKATKQYNSQFVKLTLLDDREWALDDRVCNRLLESAEVAFRDINTASNEVVNGCAEPLASVDAQKQKRKAEAKRGRRLGKPEKRDPLAKLDVQSWK